MRRDKRSHHVMRSRLVIATSACVLCLSLCAPAASRAGSFIAAGETFGVDVIAHPAGYSGAGGEIEVTICVDPASPNAADMVIPAQNIATTFNGLLSVSPNLSFSEIAFSEYDFESVALHEIGHCIGLGHPNLGAQAGVADTDSTASTDGANNAFNEGAGADAVIGSGDDPRGDDVNLHWFRVADNNPFLLGTVFDDSTYSRDVADLPGADVFAANADRTVGSSIFGVSNTEAVMQQGSFNSETQRDLAADDEATLRLGMSGLDETQGTADDYTIKLTYAGLTDTCDVVMRFNNAVTSFAVCQTSFTFLTGNHIAITSATASFNTSAVTWFFNDVVKTDGLIFEDGFESGNTEAWSAKVP